MVEKIRRKPITNKAAGSAAYETNSQGTQSADEIDPDFGEVVLDTFDAPEDAGWVEKCNEQRNLLDAALNARVDQIRQAFDNSMRKFLRS